MLTWNTDHNIHQKKRGAGGFTYPHYMPWSAVTWSPALS